MPCSCDHYKDMGIEKQHREAANIHVKLLDLRGEEVSKEFRRRAHGSSTAQKLNGDEVEVLCAFLKELGGTDYTAKLVTEHPTNANAAKVHAWAVSHASWDARREREEAWLKSQAEFRRDQDAVYARMAASRGVRLPQ